jgi:hypothetical protein
MTSMQVEDGRRRDENSAAVDTSAPPSMPRWVKVFGIIAALLILLAVVAMFVAGGKHGPGRHLHGHSAVGRELAHFTGA